MKLSQINKIDIDGNNNIVIQDIENPLGIEQFIHDNSNKALEILLNIDEHNQQLSDFKNLIVKSIKSKFKT
jgi:hypothetical protein